MGVGCRDAGSSYLNAVIVVTRVLLIGQTNLANLFCIIILILIIIFLAMKPRMPHSEFNHLRSQARENR